MTSSAEKPVEWCPPDLGLGEVNAAPIADGEWIPPKLIAVTQIEKESTAEGSKLVPSRDGSYDSGYADGMRDGTARAGDELRQIIDTLRQAAEAFENLKQEFLRDLERNVHALSVAVARKLVQREVEADPRISEELVREALELLPHETTIDLRLHPADVALIQEKQGRDAESEGFPKIQWIADPSIERGGFLMESPLRIIDGRVDVALRALYERLEHD